jgi:iron complex outermembrane receptor protein
MKNYKRASLLRKMLTAATLSGVAVGSLAAQPTPAPATAADEPIVLSPFVITGDQTGRYQPTETTSGGRVRVRLFDAPQSVSVVTRELVDDVAAGRLLDALQYISGVTESTIPNGLDRTTIRGFQTDGQRIDNFGAPNQVNLDPVFIERIEVVKGPNAILAPSGVPGGTINAVTRKPQFENFGSVTGIVGLYNAQRIEFDVNRVVSASGNTAFRVVGAFQDTEGYAGDFRETFVVMPMVSFRTRGGAELVLQAAYTDSRVQNYFGIPIDPSSGTNNRARLLAGVPRDLNTAGEDYRDEERPEFRALLTLPITESISMRLAARYTDFNISFLQNLATTGVSGGGVDPLTGAFIPGTVFGPAPTFTPSPAPTQTRIFTRNGSEDFNHYSLVNFQNDYIHQYKSDIFSATTVVGGSFDMTRQNFKSFRSTKPDINYDAPSVDPHTIGALSTRQDTTNYASQAYISESLTLLQDRLILNGGYSYNNYDQATDNLLPNRTSNPPEALPTDRIARYRANITTELKSYGILIKPIPAVALYYSYSENSTPNSAYNIGRNNAAPLQSGQQDEYGVRVDLFDNRVTASLAYFDIIQSNYSVPNPGNYVPNPPNPPLPALVSDRIAKGYEFEFRARITTALSLIGNLTTFTNRDPNGVPFRGTAEKSGAIWANYEFAKDTALDGFSIGLGVTHLGDRPGDSASGVTAASTSDNIIPNQPSFYLPARTLVNISASYRFNANWRAQLNLDNVLNEDYLAASITRYVVVPGDDFNARLRVTYSF